MKCNKIIPLIFVSLLFAGVSFFASLQWGRSYFLDMTPPLCAARRLLAGLNPYEGCTFYVTGILAQYPMTMILANLPFTDLPSGFDTAAVWGVINGLLAFGVLRTGKPDRLLLFASAPYAIAFVYHQYSPLFAAVMLMPGLLPLALIKPQIGLPVILPRLTVRRAAACAAFVILTFLVYPLWPLDWYPSASTYDGVIPLLTLPLGPFMLLALLGPHKQTAWTLFLFACMPQRSPYDLLPLMVLAKSRLQMLSLIVLGWIGIWIGLPGLMSPRQNVQISLAFIYLPLLILQLMELPFFRVFGAEIRRWAVGLIGKRV